MSEKSIFYTVFKIFIQNNLVSLYQKTKETFNVLKMTFVFGVNPSIENTEKSSEEEIKGSKLLFNFIAVLIVLRISLREVFGKGFSNIEQAIHSLYLLLLYYMGLNLFLLLGRFFSLFNNRDNKSKIDKMFIFEFNFLFIITLLLSFIWNNSNPENEMEGMNILFFLIIHTSYFSIRLFYSEFKMHALIKFAFSILVIILAFIILFLPTVFFATT